MQKSYFGLLSAIIIFRSFCSNTHIYTAEKTTMSLCGTRTRTFSMDWLRNMSVSRFFHYIAYFNALDKIIFAPLQIIAPNQVDCPIHEQDRKTFVTS